MSTVIKKSFLDLFKLFLPLINYFNPQVALMCFLGIASGIPLSLSFSTVNLWLASIGVNKVTIGLLSIAALPYLIKFLWAPILDNLKIPYLTKKLGKRRAVIVCTQICLVSVILALGFNDPHSNLTGIFLLLFLLSFFAASQDIVMDAYRIELLNLEEQGLGSAYYILGYRVGEAIGGFFTVLIADYACTALNICDSNKNWGIAFAAVSTLILVAWITLFFLPENINVHKPVKKISWFQSFSNPFTEFVKHKYWFIMLMLVFTYRINHQFIAGMENPLCIELGFTLTQIAVAVKFFGFISNLIGTFLGAVLVYKLGLRNSLMLGAVLPLIGSIILILQYYVGANLYLLYFYTGYTYFVSGLGGGVLLTYFDILCKTSGYTSTQYAFFTSFFRIGKVLLPALAGYTASYGGWNSFFALSILLSFIPIVLLSLPLIKFDCLNNKTT